MLVRDTVELMSRALVLLVLSACGRFGFSEAAGTIDAIGRGDGGPPDEPGFSLDATIVADGVAAEETCGTTMLLQDGFDTAGAAPTFMSYAHAGMTVVETGSVLEVSFAANVSDGFYGGYYAANAQPTEGLCGSVRVIDTATSDGMTFLKLQSTDQDVEFIVHRGELRVRTKLQGSVANLLVIPFDPVAHQFLRIRQQGGMTYWDVSSDGTTYAVLVSTSFVTDPMLTFHIGAGAFGSSTNAGRAAFDTALLTGP